MSVVGVEVDGLVISGDGLFVPFEVLEVIGLVVVGTSVVGVEADGLVISGDGLLVPLEGLEGIAFFKKLFYHQGRLHVFDSGADMSSDIDKYMVTVRPKRDGLRISGKYLQVTKRGLYPIDGAYNDRNDTSGTSFMSL